MGNYFTFLQQKHINIFTFSHIVLVVKITFSPNLILAGQKKNSKTSLLLRSKKGMIWHFSENPTKRKTNIKKSITSANERDKAHF